LEKWNLQRLSILGFRDDRSIQRTLLSLGRPFPAEPRRVALATIFGAINSDVIVPAATAAILGGVSLSGGTGRPLGIAIGMLVLGVLHAGFNALGAPPYANEIAMGAVLLVVAIADGPYLLRRVRMARLRITKARQNG
jgi:hypothetical protein